MARPQSNTVSYFPFLCEEGSKMFYLEETYGNDGFATFVKLLRELAKAENHFLDLSKNTTLMFLSAKCKVQKQTLESIINDLSELGKFDKTLWVENRIIWCQDFIDSIQDAYIKRKSKCITYSDLLSLLSSLGIRKPDKSQNQGDINPQSIVEKNKVKKRRVEKVDFIPPTLDETIEFFAANGYDEKIATKAWKHYNVADWHNSQGKKVANWKQTFQGNWFKEEGNITEQPAQQPKSDLVYYRWKDDPTGKKRTIEKDKADAYFANMNNGGYIAELL